MKAEGNLAVMILDLDKLTKEEFSELFKKAAFYIAKIKEESYNDVTNAVEQIQEAALTIEREQHDPLEQLDTHHTQSEKSD